MRRGTDLRTRLGRGILALVAAWLQLAACAAAALDIDAAIARFDGGTAPVATRAAAGKAGAPASFRIDPALERRVPKGMASAPGQRIAVVANGKTTGFFAEDEMLLVARDDGELRRFAARYKAASLRRVDLPRGGARGAAHAVHLMRLHPVAVAPSTLKRIVDRHFAARAGGSYAFSSPDALALAARALEASAEGYLVGLNWSHQLQTLNNGLLLDGVNAAETGFINPFQLAYLRRGPVQDIGVTQAWQFLAVAGRLDEDRRALPQFIRRVGIVDGGFHRAMDLPGRVRLSGVAFDVPNPASCGGTPCPWHGASSAEAAAAIPGNGRAAAGPAGPVAEMILLGGAGYRAMDIIAYIAGALEAGLARPNVISMSFTGNVVSPLDVTLAPLALATRAARSGGILIFGAAGNDGSDIDELRCTPLGCHERSLVSPCELTQVICVGSLADASARRAAFSNFGSGTGGARDTHSVDLFAPGSVLVGPDPANPGGPNEVVQRVQGTSISAPFAAGVAALIWSADPRQDADTVADRLLRNASRVANLPPTVAADPTVTAWVNAWRPVREALIGAGGGTNFTPAVAFKLPLLLFDVPARAERGVARRFEVNAIDIEDADDCCRVAWAIDGVVQPGIVGTSADLTFATTGMHGVTATVTDRAGASAVATMTVRVREP